MFAFLKRATPAIEVGNALWDSVLNGPETRGLADAASDEAPSHATVFEEAVYFMSFATDLTIHRAFDGSARRKYAMREAFLEHLRSYAIERHCPPCPVGDWLGDSNIWEIHSPGQELGHPLKHLEARFDLYAQAMPRSAQRSLPVVGVLCALCDTRYISFDMLATSFFIDYSIHTQDFLRKIRIEP